MANPFAAINACRSISHLPTGSPIQSSTKHALLVLSTYWPNIWPSQDRLAEDMGLRSRSQVTRRIQPLVDAGLVSRSRRWNNSTVYTIDLEAVKACSTNATYDGASMHPSCSTDATLTSRTRNKTTTQTDDAENDGDSEGWELPF